MKVLAINGSPKGARSNTWQLAQAFLKGMHQAGETELREVEVNRLDIKPCLGCFACWNKTPGSCCLRDDMTGVLESLLWADVILWSFPLYYFGIPGPLKNLMDRQLPTSLPFMIPDSEFGGHPSRQDRSQQRNVVISTCGFYTAKGNYDGVVSVFDHLCGKGKYTAIFCGQGELFRVQELRQRTGEYLECVTKAGREFSAGAITQKTWQQLETLLYPRQVFEAMADASWGVEKNGEEVEESLIFTRQMAALYNKSAWKGKDLILEMNYTDIGKRYQILLTKNGSTVITENLRGFTTKIETPYTVWKAIAAGEISGVEAMMQQLYRVKGDFSLMIQWDTYFGNQEPVKHEAEPAKALTNMNIMLIPWLSLWVVGAIDSFYGALASIIICTAVPLVFYRHRKTLYDMLSGFFVTLCGGALLLDVSPQIILPLSYLAFGLMWSISCLCKLPLTAHYSANDYGGDAMLQNPLFLKTNRILTACWGILYLFTSIWTWILLGTPLAPFTGAINSLVPMAMGAFTLWFQKWYPAKVAAGD